jgi:hypothetical protein
MPLPGVLPRQPSLLNNIKQLGNKMLLPGVLPRQPSLLTSGKQLGEGFAPDELRSKPCTAADEVEGLVVHSLGAMSHRCTNCNALRFQHEKKRT